MKCFEMDFIYCNVRTISLPGLYQSRGKFWYKILTISQYLDYTSSIDFGMASLVYNLLFRIIFSSLPVTGTVKE